MTEKMKGFFIRSLSGLIYILLIAGALLAKNAIFFYILFSLIASIAVFEFNGMSKVARTHPMRIILDCGTIIWIILMGFFTATNSSFGLTIWVPLIFYILFILTRSIVADENHELERINNSFFPIAYIGIPFFLASLVSYKNGTSSSYDGIPVLSVFLIVWANDTGAYIIGSLMGKHKLLPRLSPKKSIEGFVGGILFAMGVSSLLPLLFPSNFGIYYLWELLIYGFLVGTFATLGDLFESMLKRRAGVKDSSKLIPGHGGILDRIDSFLFTMPVAFMLMLIVSFR